MGLRFFNTMGRTIQDFIPLVPGKAGFYGCGPTVYNYAHIGNLRAYVFLDILDRAFTFLGYDKTHVMNITDIGHLSGDADDGEDKMVKTARERGASVLEVAAFYTDAFFKDFERLNIKMPDVVCKATDHVPEMIDLIKRIEANGHTYSAGGNLYYDVSTFPDYGKLAGINLDDLKAGARIEVDANKRNPADFVLWFTKSKFENQALVWESPWGTGYPGWHIECSAMSMKYLGEEIDIHTGGIDHIPVHHTNEIAQSEGATGKRWVRYWLHNEFLVIAKDKPGKAEAGPDSAKMSKSSGNFLTLQSIIDAGYSPLDYRYFLLGAHYRSQAAFSWEAMTSAKNSRAALVQRVAKILAAANVPAGGAGQGAAFSGAAKSALAEFTEAIENDLAVPRALSALQTSLKNPEIPDAQKIALAERMDSVFALRLIDSARESLESAASPQVLTGGPTGADIEALIQQRAEAKKAKNYAEADRIRSELKEKGIALEDTPSGTIWKRL
jgi:cysteinyl-tRNA synthetase